MDLESQLKILIALAYKEDGKQDITSEVLCDDETVKEAVIVSREDGVLCGLNFLEQIIQAVDEDVLIDPFMMEGDELKERMMVASIEAKCTTLLRVERVIMNFLSRLSGVASLTNKFVQEVEGTGAVILDTRKTVPGWRYLDKYAVKTGGGINHRMNLSDVAMIKDSHIDIMGNVSDVIKKFIQEEPEKPLIVEVRNLDEFNEAMGFSKSLNRIMLDNFDLESLREAVDISSGKILLEASGGANLENVREIAETGVHFISVGALTHSPKAFDFTFRIS